jgi:predicted membrane-bound dolichyl-phosphate-mannose-protein mannosyltransferase
MCTVARAMLARLQASARRRPSLPLWLLGILLLVSFVARLAWIAEPCRAPCRSPDDHTLIFDEDYYVNAARVIDRIHPPTGAPYANSPLGTDPNSEHPPLAKLIIAGGIELFGDGPIAWRLPSVLLGTVAMLGMFALVRAAGGGRWTALGAAGLMAADNLLLVHGRIATLDIYAVAAMIWAAALYLRGRPILAGVVVGIGTCAKEVTPYVLFVFALLELLRWIATGRRSSAGAGLVRAALCAGASAVAFLALLALLYRIVPPYDPQTGKLVSGLPFGEVERILSYGAHQTSPHGPRGIASYPWDWLVDIKPITYLRINPARPTVALNLIEPAVHFLGMINPAILLLAIPAMVFAALGVGGRRFRVRDEVGLVGLAWFLGTFLPFVLLSLIESRTSYLYYMVIVMPGIYMAVADLIGRIGPVRILCIAWMVAVVGAAVVMYPFTPLP